MTTLKHLPASATDIIHVDRVRRIEFGRFEFGKETVTLHVSNDLGGLNIVTVDHPTIVEWYKSYMQRQLDIGVAPITPYLP